MSKREKTEYECKCECVIKGKGKEKKMVVRFNRIVTVPHCYPSVVRNTLETSIKVSVGVEVKFIVIIKGASVVVRGGAKVDTLPGTLPPAPPSVRLLCSKTIVIAALPVTTAVTSAWVSCRPSHHPSQPRMLL